MFNGKMKAITFSYDDGVFQDRRLVEIFNKYGLKCTFNVNSGLFGKGSRTVMPEEMPELYKGHEVAVHCITHPHLSKLESDEEIINEVEGDRKRLSEIMGYDVVGMAYPYGDYDGRVVDIIRNHTGVLYSRGVPQSLSLICLASFLLSLRHVTTHAINSLSLPKNL
jgi:peptidoglycan/xylan/chitin deacetylase (PgdA/CDA1 family)